MSFKDHFSHQSKTYAQYRPSYPNVLYELIYQLVREFNLALDCGTGNGQVAIELAKRFDKVIATDASANQIENAILHPKVEYKISQSENIELDDNSVDLITVGQAIHWFHFDRFFKEVQRVVKPGGVFACWTYKYLTINQELDEVLEQFFNLMEKYWPPERDFVMAEYQTIPFPNHFIPIEFPNLFIEKPMTAENTLGYLGTWSSVKNYRKQHQEEDPLQYIKEAFFKVWGDIESEKIIRHPLITKVFRIQK